MEKISIIGCGWLGFPLAKYLGSKGYYIKGSTTDTGKLPLLLEEGIEAHLMYADPDFSYDSVKKLFEADTLIINIPPPRREDVIDYHKAQIANIADAASDSGVNNILFISSTSVYPNIGREVTEEEMLDPEKNSGKALRVVEDYLMKRNDFRTTVLRLSGLIGYDRNPRNFLMKRNPVRRANVPVNLIHRDDCTEIIFLIIQKELWGEILNATSDYHPKRKEFYESEVKRSGLEIKDYIDDYGQDYKLVSNRKLKELLDYEFKYPDPLDIE